MGLQVNTKTSFLLSCEEYINITLEFCRYRGISCAAWRTPGGDDIHIIVDFAGASQIDRTTLEDVPSGFIFSPFDKEKKALHIQSELHINLKSQKIECLSSEKLDSFTEFLEERVSKRPDSSNSNLVNGIQTTDSSAFINLVNTALSGIKKGPLQKVVPSRYKKLELSHELNSGIFFSKLCSAYKNAFVSLVFDPSCGLWLGATPELLLEVGESNFSTVALAGTQKYEGQPLSDVAWTQKEIEEQAFVSRYIINCFKKIRLREFEEIGPKTIKAGNLIHLKTLFTVDMASVNFSDLGSVMLELLHPTSAICGMPLEPSLEFLQKNERYDREYFSGYLGPTNFKDKTSLFVNLRCMKVRNKIVTLYAGAGVTEDSNPDREWHETEMKMNTLLNLFD
ncbi:MAG: chorismate-binding protein [Bacteroidota bacterium]